MNIVEQVKSKLKQEIKAAVIKANLSDRRANSRCDFRNSKG